MCCDWTVKLKWVGMYIFVQGRNRLGEKKVLDRKKKCYIVGDVTTKKWACLRLECSYIWCHFFFLMPVTQI